MIRNNNQADNLAFLCLEHHDSYDSSTSQSKGFISREVKYYWRLLYLHVQLPPTPSKAATKRNPVTGLFFDYDAVVVASFYRKQPETGWACTIEIAGENYETGKFEVVGLVVKNSFRSAAAAVRHGERVVKMLGISCIEIRSEEL